MDTIKLLIWDLDETFWKGTLSDGEITPVPENIELVKHLTDRGIVNSICSKNDYEKTKAKLEELGVWEYFVFPSIDWTPKGQRVKNIISDMNLRPVNCLFIDDNVNNLEEAKFAAGGGINVSLPDDLPELLKDPAFEGKDDSEHSRLKQYKILEEKAAARAQSGSNEEFLYQSEIHVELIEDCSDKLVRIYEMIHRNNQLNFTKDRISQEEVDRIFTDPEITSGVVHVTDKYGDHGIIGCYAIKDGKALQLVFSCRILGMGVEQWVYAELGYPEIEVVGEVAAELNKTDKPEWINNTTSVQKETVTSSHNTPRFIAYGSCSLRPVWAYLQPKLPDAKFAEIDPTPCCLNLAVALRESEDKKKEIMLKVDSVNNECTFDMDVYSPETKYILITLQGTENMKKYVSKDSKSYFYSIKINKMNADIAAVLNEYDEFPIEYEDMMNDLSYICDHLPSGTKLLMQTLPEVEFPQKGKDRDFYYRKEENRVAEDLAEKYPDVICLIDIRKYAKSPTDFFEPIPNHYNRNIGYFLAEDILNIMGLNASKIQHEDNLSNNEDMIPDNAVVQDFPIPGSEDKCTIVTYIVNGIFTADVKLNHPEKYLIQCTVMRNRFNEFTSEIVKRSHYEINVLNTGRWKVAVAIYNAGNQMLISNFSTAPINYTKYNYLNFLDSNKNHYENAVIGYNELVQKNMNADSIYASLINQIAELSALGVNPFEYFLSQGIDEISVFTDKRIGEVILPYIHRSGIKIRHLFAADNIWRLKSYVTEYKVNDINTPLPLSEKDTVLFSFDGENFGNIRIIFSKSRAKIVSLSYVLSYLLTKYLFVEKFKSKVPRIIAVRTANLHRYTAFEYSKLTVNEKMLEDNKFFNESDVINRVNSNYDSLPEQVKKYSKDKLLETLKVPHIDLDPNTKIQRFDNISGQYVNIINGIRHTENDPDSFIGTIYIFGGPQAYGYGVGDNETIASYLQNILSLPYRVLNYANCWHYDYTAALNLMESIDFRPNDIAIFLVSNWQVNLLGGQYFHWLRWEAIEAPIIKVDAFPLFEKRDRPDYFLHRYGYTPACNMELAKLIRDAVYENIKLFDI